MSHRPLRTLAFYGAHAVVMIALACAVAACTSEPTQRANIGDTSSGNNGATTNNGTTSSNTSNNGGTTTNNGATGTNNASTSTNNATTTADAGTDTDPPEDTGPPEDTNPPDVPEGEGARVRIGTFNVKRYFDTRCDTGSCDIGDFEDVLTDAEFDARAEEIADAIRAMDVDVILLQEIETQRCLDAVWDNLRDLYGFAQLGEVGYAGSLDVAVMGAGSLLEVRTHQDNRIPLPGGGTTTFTRELLEVHTNLNGVRVIALVTHFKSKSNDDANRRLAEAQAAREITLDAAAAHPDAIVVLGGDLNDTPGSAPLNAIEEGGQLFRVSSTLAQDWTFTFQGNLIAIDHLYLAETTGAQLVPDSPRVFREGRGGWGGSDHASLAAEFVYPD